MQLHRAIIEFYEVNMSLDFRDHVTLGQTGLKVSRLGIAASYGVPAEAITKAYHENQINLFYWGSRRHLEMRKALRELAPSERDRMVIAFQTYDKSGLLTRSKHESGLKKLGVDHADILILGWMRGVPRGWMLESALKLREEGKVRYLAISSHNRSLIGSLVGRKELPVDIYMLRYNAAHRGAEKDIFPYIPDQDTPGIMAYTTTCWGKLLMEKNMPPGQSPLTAADCYRFVLSNPLVDLALIGPRNALELAGGLQALEDGPMTGEELINVRKVGDYVYGKK